MELRHLRYFVAVAEELHFTRAAARLHIGQPPLSQQIQALEAELGAALFIRSKRRVALTEAGRRFLVRARDILAATQSAADEARRAARGEIGELRIAYTSSLPLTPRWSQTLRDYRQRYPEVRLILRDMFTGQQFEALQQGTLDIGFVRYNADEPAPEAIQLRELVRDPLRMVLPAEHPLADEREVLLARFRDEGFVMYPEHAGAGLAKVILRLCENAGFKPKVVQEAQEATTLIGLVAAGLGVTVMPSPLECVKVADVRYVPLGDYGAHHTMALATREGQMSPLVAQFIEQLPLGD